jgi:glycosyltransferase involved in cell wall biosynthesis
MRILLVSPLPPPTGGIATWTGQFLDSDIINQHKVDVVNISVTGSRVDQFVKKNLKDEIQRTLNILHQIKAYKKTGPYNIIHMNTSCSKHGLFRDLIIVYMAKSKTSKVVLHCHCDTSYQVQGKLMEWVFTRLLKSSDLIFSLNSFSSEHIKKLSGKDACLMPNFYNKKDLDDAYTRDFQKEVKRLLFVGRIVNSKGCDKIIQVAKHFPDKEFELIGYLSEEIKELARTDNVHFRGELTKEEVHKAMKESDALIFPSLSEGFPLVVLEAMALGLPIITTGVGAIPDMIEESGGLYIDSKDIKSMISAIQKIEDPKLRRSMSTWSKSKVKDVYLTEKVIDKIVKEYTKVSRR